MPPKGTISIPDKVTPADDYCYRKVALMFATRTTDPDELTEVLKQIGHPAFHTPEQDTTRPKPNYANAHTGKLDRCRRNLHDMTGDNVTVDSSGRRCRACRRETDQRRKKGRK